MYIFDYLEYQISACISNEKKGPSTLYTTSCTCKFSKIKTSELT